MILPNGRVNFDQADWTGAVGLGVNRGEALGGESLVPSHRNTTSRRCSSSGLVVDYDSLHQSRHRRVTAALWVARLPAGMRGCWGQGGGGSGGGGGVIISLSSALISHFFYILVCLSSKSLSIFLSFFVSLSHSLSHSLPLASLALL